MSKDCGKSFGDLSHHLMPITVARPTGGDSDKNFTRTWILNFNILNHKGSALLVNHGCFCCSHDDSLLFEVYEQVESPLDGSHTKLLRTITGNPDLML